MQLPQPMQVSQTTFSSNMTVDALKELRMGMWTTLWSVAPGDWACELL